MVQKNYKVPNTKRADFYKFSMCPGVEMSFNFDNKVLSKIKKKLS